MTSPGDAVSWDEDPAGRVLEAPQEREGVPLLEHVVGVGDRPVEEDRVPLGQRAVVHDRAAVDRDVDRPADFARRVDHLVADVLPAVVVAHPVQFPGGRVTVRVAGPRSVQAAAEVGLRQALQLVGQLDGQHARLRERPGLAGLREDVRVHHVVGDVAGAAAELLRAGQRRQALTARDVIVADEAVPVPFGLAVADADPVHHPVAGEPVVGHRVLRVDRVRPHAQQAAVQVLRDGSGHLQVVDRNFLVDGCERALEPAVAELRLRLRSRMRLGHGSLLGHRSSGRITGQSKNAIVRNSTLSLGWAPVAPASWNAVCGARQATEWSLSCSLISTVSAAFMSGKYHQRCSGR